MRPSTIGKYKVTSQIGKGGMGAVYKAIHPTLKKTVIIKQLTLTGSEAVIERFRREASVMIDFTDEKIVQVYDHFKDEGTYNIVMEYVDGVTLAELIESQRFLHEEAALVIFGEICQALKYAHQRNVIHRDMKPGNILISKSGVVKLVDFGVSTSLDAEVDDGLTKDGMTIGTPSYLAPEQIANAKKRDKRSDIYSLGVILYEMVLGKKPFPGSFSPDVIALIGKGKYPLPRKINPKIKPATQRIIRKAMHHKVSRRYQDLGRVIRKLKKYRKHLKASSDVQSALQQYLEGNDDAFLPASRGLSAIKRRILATALTAILIVCVAGLGAWWGIQKGYHTEWLNPDQYGALRIKVKARKGNKEAREIYIKALLYTEENNKLTRADHPPFRFLPVDEEESRGFYAYESRKVYLPQGAYKLVLYAENEQFRENFYLYSRREQKQRMSTSKGRKIFFSTATKHPSLPVDAVCEVMDMDTGKSLRDQAQVDVYSGSNWISWNDFTRKRNQKSGFYSGRRYRLRFSSEGYYRKHYYLTIQPEQTRVSLKINLVPAPGKVIVSSEVDEVSLWIDGSDQYISGGREKEVQKLSPLSAKEREIVLSPGEYRFAAKSGALFNQDLSVQEIVVVKPGGVTRMKVKRSSDSDVLRFHIQK